MTAELMARGLPPEDLAKTLIRFPRAYRLLGIERSVAYRSQRDGRFPVRVVRDVGGLYCYSAEVDAHMRGDHENCFHRYVEPRNGLDFEPDKRDIEMARLFRQGMSQAEIARLFGITRQRAAQILDPWKPPTEDDDQ